MESGRSCMERGGRVLTTSDINQVVPHEEDTFQNGKIMRRSATGKMKATAKELVAGRD